MVAAGVALLFVPWGLHLRRPITLMHTAAAVLCVAAADLAYTSAHAAGGVWLIAATGPVLMLPVRSVPQSGSAVVAQIAGTRNHVAMFALALRQRDRRKRSARCCGSSPPPSVR
ncbi:hypothetical protein L1080_001250 [Rhodococcus sp. MSC1_016]|jgi:hypothetical protein|uniref:hypothetical protein n=1 Tax=Rhodococcus sp. MSC1_016 TaxID=2909266 RepID=UPI00202E2690|nr:hypothetical protein [Rhodococcus sp. MSC1_016]